MKPSVRAAKTSDIPAITRIYAHAVEHGTASFELESPDETEMARRMADLTGKGFPYIVAEIDGVLAGYAYVGPFRTRPAYRLTVENSVYVAHNIHRRGVGRALLAALIVASEAAGHRQMIAVIGDSTQQAASIALHADAGFKHAGILPDTGFKHGRWLDTVLMQRAIGAGGKTEP
jgi:phosphinothricin acetyltransferase